MKLYNQTNNEADKTILKAKLDNLTEDINKLNPKIQTCRRIISKSEKEKKEDLIIQERIQDNKKKKKKETDKNKYRKNKIYQYDWNL